jgi:hypothetical protein
MNSFRAKNNHPLSAFKTRDELENRWSVKEDEEAAMFVLVALLSCIVMIGFICLSLSKE